MATTSIWAVKGWLGSVIIYTEDPDKTTNPSYYKQEEVSDYDLQGLSDVITYAKRDDATFRQQLVTGVNCCADTAREEMLAVKARYGKTDGIVAYHGYQSFRPGETTPNQAHEIGIKLAEQLWGDRYQVVVATHVDKNHIHSHFVVNSVSYSDGKKYHRTKADYAQMRTASDNLCREHGLSIIEQQHGSKKKSPSNRTNQSWRQSVKADVEEAISQSFNYDNLVDALTITGYEVEWIYELKIRPANRKNFIHVNRILGVNYSSDSILRRMAHNASSFLNIPLKRYYRPTVETAVVTTMMRLATDSILETLKLICYLLTQHSHAKQHAQQIHPALREDIKKLDSYVAQARVLEKYQIHTPKQLSSLQTTLEDRITELEHIRKPLYRKVEQTTRAADRGALRNEINEITSSIKVARAELKVCKHVAKQKLPDTRVLLENTAKEKRRNDLLLQ